MQLHSTTSAWQTAQKLKLHGFTSHITSQASMSLIPAQSVPPHQDEAAVSLRSWFDSNAPTFNKLEIVSSNAAVWGKLGRTLPA